MGDGRVGEGGGVDRSGGADRARRPKRRQEGVSSQSAQANNVDGYGGTVSQPAVYYTKPGDPSSKFINQAPIDIRPDPGFKIIPAPIELPGIVESESPKEQVANEFEKIFKSLGELNNVSDRTLQRREGILNKRLERIEKNLDKLDPETKKEVQLLIAELRVAMNKKDFNKIAELKKDIGELVEDMKDAIAENKKKQPEYRDIRLDDKSIVVTPMNDTNITAL